MNFIKNAVTLASYPNETNSFSIDMTVEHKASKLLTKLRETFDEEIKNGKYYFTIAYGANDITISTKGIFLLDETPVTDLEIMFIQSKELDIKSMSIRATLFTFFGTNSLPKFAEKDVSTLHPLQKKDYVVGYQNGISFSWINASKTLVEIAPSNVAINLSWKPDLYGYYNKKVTSLKDIQHYAGIPIFGCSNPSLAFDSLELNCVPLDTEDQYEALEKTSDGNYKPYESEGPFFLDAEYLIESITFVPTAEEKETDKRPTHWSQIRLKFADIYASSFVSLTNLLDLALSKDVFVSNNNVEYDKSTNEIVFTPSRSPLN